MDGIHFRSILDILKDSQVDHATYEGDNTHKSIQSEVRFKLIIDPSEDDSLVRLLFTYGVLQRENTRLYICSDFPGDTRSRVSELDCQKTLHVYIIYCFLSGQYCRTNNALSCSRPYHSNVPDR